jgi:hypothetical protein
MPVPDVIGNLLNRLFFYQNLDISEILFTFALLTKNKIKYEAFLFSID